MSELVDPSLNSAAETPPAISPIANVEAEPPVLPPTLENPTIAPLPAGSKRAQRAQKKSAPALGEKGGREKDGRRKSYTLVTIVSTLRSMVLVFAVAVIVGTIFTSFTSNDSLSAQTRQNLAEVQVTEAHRVVEPTLLPTPAWFSRIGVVAGHSGIATYGDTKGNIDPGAVCKADGFTEASVTMKVATQVVAALRGRGYTVDLLEEFDLRLDHPDPYQAGAFLSLHADSCDNFNDGFPHSGFKIINPTLRLSVRDQDLRLVDCMRNYYARATGLPYAEYSVTENMTNYHSFHQIAQRTPAGIIELGFLYYDRDVLEHHTDKVAQGIVDGFLCFLDPQALSTAAARPSTSPTRPTALTLTNVPTPAPPSAAPRKQ